MDLVGNEDTMINILSDAVKGGVSMVRIREYNMPKYKLVTFIKKVVEITKGALVLVSEDVQLAIKSGAHGVHLSENSVQPKETEGLLIGRSVHSLEMAQSIYSNTNTDFLVLGHIFKTPSHKLKEPIGIETLRKCVRAVNIPIIGIGGINSGNAKKVMQAGAAGVAIIRSIVTSSNPYLASIEIKKAINL